MHWILQNNIFKEQKFDELVSTLERFDIPHSVHKIIPFIGQIEPDINPEGNVICMGSYSLRHLAKERNWYPGVFDLEPFDFKVQLEHWGRRMLNHLSRVYEFKDAKFPWYSICSAHQLANPGESECPRCQHGTYGDHAFIRPIADSKVFAGRVFEKSEFEEWQRKVCVLEEDDGSSLRGNTLVQVVEPIQIYSEYRFWIVGGEIITASMYKRGDRIHYSPEVDQRFYDYVRECLDIWQPMDTFVIDVCDTKHGIKIVEINTLNSCGYYAANMTSLVLALEDRYNS